MSLLEHAAVEAAKKFAENEENRTDTRGVVKASKVFPVVSVFSVLMGIAMALLKLKQGGVMFYVLAAAFVLLGVFLLIYGHNFKIEYDRTGITVYNFFGKPKQYELQDAENRTEKRRLYRSDRQGKNPGGKGLFPGVGCVSGISA